MYQNENTVNIEIKPPLHKQPITHKYDANDIIKSGITNYYHGSRHIYMDNQYADPPIFGMMESNYNPRAVEK